MSQRKTIRQITIVAIALAVAATAPLARSQSPSSNRAATTDQERLARSLYQELVNTNTMDTVGSTTRAARDEKLRTKSFYDGLDFLDKLVRRLAGGAQ